MSLIPGSPRYDTNEEKYVLDDPAMQNSMALEIEEEMKNVYKALKGKNMPDVGEEDRRMLFSAVARGVLKYLNDNAYQLIKAVTIAHTSGGHPYTDHSLSGLDLDIEVTGL